MLAERKYSVSPLSRYGRARAKRIFSATISAFTPAAAAQGPALPVRSGWLGEDQLILFVTLDERAVTLPQLHQAVTTLTRLQREVLAS